MRRPNTNPLLGPDAAASTAGALCTWVALLRGVNVGKAQRVPMETLRSLLAGMGCTQVRTLLNSGNSVFRAPGPATSARALALASGLVQALRSELKLEVPVVVKSAAQWAALVDGNPFGGAGGGSATVRDPSRLLVALTQDEGSLQALQRIEGLVSLPEAFTVGPHAAYLHCPDGILDSHAGQALLGKVGQAVTSRNWATTLKIQALARAMAP